jgi:small subunit ribosomal protein S16
MVKIRLRRVGAKKQPYYRVVVTDSSAPRDGRFIETIGNYNPRTDPPTVEIDAERALHWLSVGAQPSAAVQRMLDKMGIMSKVAAVRKGEVSIEELAEQIRLARMEAEPKPVETEVMDEEIDLDEAEDEELDAETESVDDEDWSDSDEDEDTEFESDYDDLDAEDTDDIDDDDDEDEDEDEE